MSRTPPKRPMSAEHRAKISASIKARNAALELASRKTVDKLSHQRKGGKPGHRVAAQRALALERRARVWRMFTRGEGTGGTTLRDIAKVVGVSAEQVRQDILAVANELQEEIFTTAAVGRMRQAAQLSSLIKTHWEKRDKVGNARIILQAAEREARLLNLDLRPPDNAYTPDQVIGLVRGIASLFMEIVDDPEQRRRFALGLRRQLGTPIDVAPVVHEERAS